MPISGESWKDLKLYQVSVFVVEIWRPLANEGERSLDGDTCQLRPPNEDIDGAKTLTVV